jgi:ABC-type iron transport system FetAB ATPase subunit
MLRVDHLKVRGLPPLSFSVSKGECLAVEGPSGCGKTLLLRAIADLDPAEGAVFLEGAERREMPATNWRRQVRLVTSEASWWADTAREHMSDVLVYDRLLTTFGLDEALLDRRLDSLSTGERQRLALVHALADDPKVLLLDEPTALLDPANAARVDADLSGRLTAGRIILLVSHDPTQIDRLAHIRLQLGNPLRDSRANPEAVASR